jgi:8-oxo-dGTP pyrophosphatase MutT (NUDIX family)
MFTIESIKVKLNLPLPGLSAQLKMAPPMRTKNIPIPTDARIGAVMILVYKKNDHWHTLFIERAKDGNTHSGQIAFPGGKKDDTDKDVIYTALRECEEEIGVPINSVEVLGVLTDLYIPPSNFIVSSIIGYISELPDLVLSKNEVANTFEIRLEDLFLPENKSKKTVKQSDDFSKEIEVPIYKIENKIDVWGATAMIIAEFETLITS